MKSTKTKIIILLIALGVFALTNPSKKQLTKHVINSELSNYDDYFNSSIKQFLVNYADRRLTKSSLVNDFIIRKNYLLFSYYKLDIPGTGDDLVYIGILNNFIKL